MIRCNLAVLLAQRGMRVSKVAADTGISRTTLTALVNNTGAGVQYDTLDTLCRYLGATIDQLLAFIPLSVTFDIRPSSSSISNGETFDLTLSMERAGRSEKYEMIVDAILGYREIVDHRGDVSDRWVDRVDLFIEFSSEEERKDQCLAEFRSIPREFIFDIESKIADAVAERLNHEDIREQLDIHVTSPFLAAQHDHHH